MKKVLFTSLIIVSALIAKESSLADNEAKTKQMKERPSNSMGEEASALKGQNRYREKTHEDNRDKTKEKKENENRYGSENSHGAQNMNKESKGRGGR